MAKGDADQLKADVDDGYARVANLLSEALCCAPLTDCEYAVVWFVMRRTYGWAKTCDRETGKLDAMTAAEIAAATNRPRRTVEKALANLAKAHVLLREVVSADNRCAYGINADVSQWGLPGAVWQQWYVALQANIEHDRYTPDSVQVYARQRTGVRQPAYGYTPTSVDPPPRNPRAPGVSDSLLQRERLDNENDLNDPSSEPAHDAGPDPAEQAPVDRSDQPDVPPDPKKSKAQREAEQKAQREADLQAAIASARADLPPELLPTLDAWLANLASHNASGTMTTGRTLSATTEFANLVDVHALTTAAIQYGVAEALAKADNKDGKDGVTAIRYVLSAAKGYNPDGARASPSLFAPAQPARPETREEAARRLYLENRRREEAAHAEDAGADPIPAAVGN